MRFLVSYAAAAALLAARSVGAEELDCFVRVKSVMASESSADFEYRSIRAGEFLADVSKQLEPLPYKKYKILDTHETRCRYAQELPFELKGAAGELNQLRVVPEELRLGKVALLLEWKDATGMELINTRIRIPNGDHVVVGSKGADEKSTIMCIHVDCKE